MRHVLVADDHEVTRRGLREILVDAFGDVEVCEAARGTEVLERLEERPWDLILLDVRMPGPNICDVITRIRSEMPTTPVLALTAWTEIEYVIETMKAGANGLIHKHHAADELLQAIKVVLDGGSYLHPETAAAIAASLRDVEAPKPHHKLSVRELEIFKQIALGKAVKEIAADLQLSDKTVATYLARIREKTGLTSHVEIARYALQHGIVD
jgi:DNA-binding NarL/FixJ family response regulator